MARLLFDRRRGCGIGRSAGERLVLGKSAFRFEEEFAKYCGVKYAISTSSQASTLQLSLLALDIKQGDYVVTAPASFTRLVKPNINYTLPLS